MGYSREEPLSLRVQDFASNLSSEEDWRSDQGALLRRDLPVSISSVAAGVRGNGDHRGDRLQILEEACHRAWQGELPEPLVLSANLSARQFRQPNFVGQIQGVIEETGLAPECLKLEVTESVAMEKVDALFTLRRLKDLGTRVATDDFGTGYSSLSYLGRFPVDTPKIDRSFVGRLEEPESAAIAATTVSLARTLGPAEGVETAGQLASLRGLGCDLAQGYYSSRPLPAGPISELLGAPLAASSAAFDRRIGRAYSAAASRRALSIVGRPCWKGVHRREAAGSRSRAKASTF